MADEQANPVVEGNAPVMTPTWLDDGENDPVVTLLPDGKSITTTPVVKKPAKRTAPIGQGEAAQKPAAQTEGAEDETVGPLPDVAPEAEVPAETPAEAVVEPPVVPPEVRLAELEKKFNEEVAQRRKEQGIKDAEVAKAKAAAYQAEQQRLAVEAQLKTQREQLEQWATAIEQEQKKQFEAWWANASEPERDAYRKDYAEHQAQEAEKERTQLKAHREAQTRAWQYLEQGVPQQVVAVLIKDPNATVETIDKGIQSFVDHVQSQEAQSTLDAQMPANRLYNAWVKAGRPADKESYAKLREAAMTKPAKPVAAPSPAPVVQAPKPVVQAAPPPTQKITPDSDAVTPGSAGGSGPKELPDRINSALERGNIREAERLQKQYLKVSGIDQTSGDD